VQSHARADVCLIVDDDITDVMAELAAAGVTIEEGPAPGNGRHRADRQLLPARPDQNLVELSNYAP
jgi:hypothetical protein